MAVLRSTVDHAAVLWDRFYTYTAIHSTVPDGAIEAFASSLESASQQAIEIQRQAYPKAEYFQSRFVRYRHLLASLQEGGLSAVKAAILSELCTQQPQVPAFTRRKLRPGQP